MREHISPSEQAFLMLLLVKCFHYIVNMYSSHYKVFNFLYIANLEQSLQFSAILHVA